MEVEMDDHLGQTAEESHARLEKGYKDMKAGRMQNVAEAFAIFMENHR